MAPKQHPGGELFMAWLPYLLLVVFVLIWGRSNIKAKLDRFTNGLLPGFLHVESERAERYLRAGPAQPDHADSTGDADSGALRRHYTLNWLSASGTSCFLAGVAAAILLRVKPSSSRRPTSPPSSSWRSRW